MINNSVYDESLGKVNGLGQSMASLARTIGPAFGGLLWSFSLEVPTYVHACVWCCNEKNVFLFFYCSTTHYVQPYLALRKAFLLFIY